MTTEEVTRCVQIMCTMAQEIEGMLFEGKSLKQISNWSYAARNGGGYYYPYLAILQTENKKPTLIGAAPVYRQKELYEFFMEMIAPGYEVIPMFVFEVDYDGVRFQMRSRNGSDGLETVDLYESTI